MTINLTKSIEMKKNEIKANKIIETMHAELKELSAVNAKVSKRIAELKDEVKDFMGEHTVLLSKSGTEMALWRQNADTIKLDEELVMENYPDVYNDCLVTKTGNLNFIIK